MKLVVLACLATVVVAFPHEHHHPGRPDYRHIPIVKDEREDRGDGNFRYEFETGHGIHVQAVGTPGSNGQSNIRGFYRFPLAGSRAEVTYEADEYGYRPESPLIPTAPPLPQHAIEQIAIAEEQARQGITWD